MDPSKKVKAAVTLRVNSPIESEDQQPTAPSFFQATGASCTGPASGNVAS